MVVTMVLLGSGCSSAWRISSQSCTGILTEPESYKQPIASQTLVAGYHTAPRC